MNIDNGAIPFRAPMVNQSRERILEIPINALIRPSIGIPPEMVERSNYRTPLIKDIIAPIEIPTTKGNLEKEIGESPNNPSRVEKQAARLIVIRRTKMNKHKLRKLRKKMKYVWAKVKLRRAIRKEKAYLNSKMELINAAKAFDAKQYVADIIKKAKEEPIPYKWQDPLMPEWFKEQEMQKEAWQERYQKMINLYLNKSIQIRFDDRDLKKKIE